MLTYLRSMRVPLLAFILLSICACTSNGVKDPLDAPIALSAHDTLTSDWNAVGPLGLLTPDRFVLPRGTLDLTTAELATLDSMAAVVRSKGGALCY